MLQKVRDNRNIQLNIVGGEKAYFQIHQVLILVRHSFSKEENRDIKVI